MQPTTSQIVEAMQRGLNEMLNDLVEIKQGRNDGTYLAAIQAKINHIVNSMFAGFSKTMEKDADNVLAKEFRYLNRQIVNQMKKDFANGMTRIVDLDATSFLSKAYSLIKLAIVLSAALNGLAYIAPIVAPYTSQWFPRTTFFLLLALPLMTGSRTTNPLGFLFRSNSANRFPDLLKHGLTVFSKAKIFLNR